MAGGAIGKDRPFGGGMHMSETPTADAATRLRVLLIDDDPDILIILKATLESKFEVGEARNGILGLEMLEKFEPDLIICDVMMPVLNGLECVEAIRQHPRFFDVPVFFLTAETSPALPQVTKQLGGNLFLPKPIEPWLLVDLIEMFLKETKLAPRERLPIQLSAPHPAPQEAHPPVRILVMDNDGHNVEKLKEILGADSGGKWETLWSVEPLAGLSRLHHMQPDVILYNPRQKAMDGLSLARFLTQRKLQGQYEIAFVGRGFLPAEETYSRQELKREPINLDQPAEAATAQIEEVLGAARHKLTRKNQTIEELTAPKPLPARHAEREERIRRVQEVINVKAR